MTQNQLKLLEIREAERANRAREEYESYLKGKQAQQADAQSRLLSAQTLLTASENKTEKLRPYQVAADTWDKATHGVKNLSDAVSGVVGTAGKMM